jgi:hypothetical protein
MGVAMGLFVAANNMFGEPLASNRLPFWLQYSGFWASCHNTLHFIKSYLAGLELKQADRRKGRHIRQHPSHFLQVLQRTRSSVS